MSGIVVLGASGSIGRQTLEIIDYLNKEGEDYNLVGVSVHKNIKALEDIISSYRPQYAVVTDEVAAQELIRKKTNGQTKILTGPTALLELVRAGEVDLVLNALVGIAGLEPSLATLKAKKKLALANKESLVTGGPLIKEILANEGGVLLPIDSEHSALWQLLMVDKRENVESLILTASGGPFRQLPFEKFSQITPESALKHPTWTMGGKISIDSATLMNKALEVIEAHWLFDFPYDRIDVIVHPESIVHSMVQLVDKSILAQMGTTDMRTPILYALSYPKRQRGLTKPLDFLRAQSLSFEKPRYEDFPALNLGYQAGKMGGTMPVVLNGANEVAVELFLAGRISFKDISYYLEKVMARHKVEKIKDLETIQAADEWARQQFYREVQ